MTQGDRIADRLSEVAGSWGFIIGFILYTITQVVTLGVIGIVGLINPKIMNLINTTDTIDINAVKSVIYLAIGVYSVYVIFYYILGKKQLEKGVNVE